jgi:hypothetical protein|tara:strand:+ start:56 stop:340 length:285 start_codon:yes stop_codon:yes gene_type:complete
MDDKIFQLLHLAISICGYTWLIFFLVKMLTKYTDFGQNKKRQREKENKVFGGDDPQDKEGKKLINMFLGENKPKIETSFGDKRIGEVHEYEKEN